MILLAELDLVSPRFRTTRGQNAFERLRALSAELTRGAAERDAQGRFPVENFAQLREANLLGLQIPEAYGGCGLGADEYCAAIAQIAAADASTALAYNMHSSSLISIALFGTGEQKKKWFARVIESGATIAALGSEPQLKPFQDGALPRTQLTRTNGGFLLNGLKSYSSFGAHANYLYVAARFENALGFALVDANSPGVTRRDDWNVMSMRSTASVTTEFDAVFVEEADVILQKDLAAALLLEVEFALGYGPIYLACACAAADLAIEGAMSRIRPDEGGAAAEGLLLASETGRLIRTARSAWLACLDAARTGEIGHFARARAIVLAKAVACDAATEIAERALRLRGGPGLMLQDPVGRAFRDVQAGQVMAFSPEFAGAMLGRFALGLAPDHIKALTGGAAQRGATLP